MRIDLGLILGIVIEIIFFIYYADTLFYRKRNKWLCYAIITVGYALNGIACMFGNIIVNSLVFLAANFLGFYLCYHVSRKNAIFHAMMLGVLCCASEYIVAFMPWLNIDLSNVATITAEQSLVVTLISRMLYLISIMVMSRLFCDKKRGELSPSLGLITIPILTVGIVTILIKMNIHSNFLIIVCVLLVIINLIVFAINQKLIKKDFEIEELRERQLKENIDFEEYTMLKNYYKQTTILNHDFKEHINALNLLVSNDNNSAAKDYMESIYGEVNQPRFIEYCDNKILNVLLSRKKEECQSRGIEFLVDPMRAHLRFLKDMDVVSIFSNLINNAIESCERSTEKKIYMNISEPNKHFVVIQIENSSDVKPLVIDGLLKTYKHDKSLHGIGISSVKSAIKKYRGLLEWDYNESEKLFGVTLVMKKPEENASVGVNN